jgi:hypothetical protein
MHTSPKISAFPVRDGELRVGSGKFPKKGVISVGSVDRRSKIGVQLTEITECATVIELLGAYLLLAKAECCAWDSI